MGKKRLLLVEIDEYNDFIAVKKEAISDEVSIPTPKSNNERWKRGSVNVTCENGTTSELAVEMRKHNDSGLKIKVTNGLIAEGPCFRYDGDGEAHRNRMKDTPLSESQVTTPHFHKFINRSTEIAYKTESLKSRENEKAIVENQDLAIAHFCQEANLKGKSKNFISLAIDEPELPLETEKQMYVDPLEGVNFND